MFAPKKQGEERGRKKGKKELPGKPRGQEGQRPESRIPGPMSATFYGCPTTVKPKEEEERSTPK